MIDSSIDTKKLFVIVSLAMLLIACDESSKDNSGIDARHLSAITDFKCDPVWTNRDGSLGIRAGDGAGICEASFVGASGFYRIRLVA